MTEPVRRFLVHYAQGSTIFQQGDAGREMFIIHRGKVQLSQLIAGEKTPLGVLEKGDFFGEMSLLEGLARTATAEALEDTDLLRVDGTAFNQMLRDNPEIAVRMLRKFSVRLRDANEKIARLAAERAADDVTADWPTPLATAQSTARVSIGPEETRSVPILGAETRIGRRDPVTGVVPEVDLAEEPGGRSVSRRHAQIVVKDGQHYLVEEIGTLNQTCLNGKRIDTGVLVKLHDGDEILVGTVQLRFHLA